MLDNQGLPRVQQRRRYSRPVDRKVRYFAMTTKASKYKACKARVSNRGMPPDSFLDELIAWAKTAPGIIFAVNDRPDVYGNVKAVLGPWKNLLHRKAVMCEVLRVLAGLESSWRWNEGRDMNAGNISPETEETGIFQVSCNARHFDPSLRELIIKTIGLSTSPSRPIDCRKFITETKTNHIFALEFAARLLRFTVKHNGPVLRHEIDNWLSRQSVAEFEKLLIA